jgi:hypothetical protein
MQLTSDLIDAEHAYRNSKQKVRCANHSIASYDSSHISNPTTGYSDPAEYKRPDKEEYERWKDHLPQSLADFHSAASPTPSSTDGSNISLVTEVGIHESLSMVNERCGLMDKQAKQGRAFEKRKRHNDGILLSKRSRTRASWSPEPRRERRRKTDNVSGG